MKLGLSILLTLLLTACDGGGGVTPPGEKKQPVQQFSGNGIGECPPGSVNNPNQQSANANNGLDSSQNTSNTQQGGIGLFDTGASQADTANDPNANAGNSAAVPAAIPNCGPPVQAAALNDCVDLLNPPEKDLCAGKMYDRKNKTCIDATPGQAWCGNVTTIEAQFTSPPYNVPAGAVSAELAGFETTSMECGKMNSGTNVPVVTMYRCIGTGDNVKLESKVIKAK